MDKPSIESILENSDYVLNLANALETNNEELKKQIFELLCALSTHSQQGYKRAIDTLEILKNLRNKQYTIETLVTELQTSRTLEFKLALLKFINCLLNSTINVKSRIRMRSELISCGLFPVINYLRQISSNESMIIQIESFISQKDCDKEVIIQSLDESGNNSYLDIFYAILHHLCDTPNENIFLNLLQYFLRVSNNDKINNHLWTAIENFVHRFIETEEDSEIMLSYNFRKLMCLNCKNEEVSSRKSSLTQSNTSIVSPGNGLPSSTSKDHIVSSNPPPPPPPFPSKSKLFEESNAKNIPIPPVPPTSKVIVQVNEQKEKRSKNEINFELGVNTTLPQQIIPTPRAKMKTINWNKIPISKVIGRNNVWTVVANNHQNNSIKEMNWEEMEGLFCQQISYTSTKNIKDNKIDFMECKRSRRDEIILLDGKRSLNINIFLKQFRTTNQEITRMIFEGESEKIGLEKLRGLLKILPEIDEIEMLKNFDGAKERLGNAEKFMLQLIDISHYKLRIDCMLLKEEFSSNISYLTPSINSMLNAAKDLITSKALQEVLYMVVLVGNFLNAGGYAGNAVGVKLSSLQKLSDIRANKPGMNLIHFVASQAEKNKELLSFANQMHNLENASKMTIEQLNNEISFLAKRIENIKEQIKFPTTEKDIILQMEKFLTFANKEILNLQQAMSNLEQMRLQLADFFCEDQSQFKIEECFKIFYHFCEKFKTAIKDNEKRRIQEEQAFQRKKQREEQLANKRKQYSQYIPTTNDTEHNSIYMDPPTISYDIRFSPAMNRRRINSINRNNNLNIETNGIKDENSKDDVNSPDITPNGSIRRRRSRILSEEEDGNLMDFLRSSGNENNSRERKSISYYGSLDRSWARCARMSNAKIRPKLLNVDFGVERERPVSPTPDIIQNDILIDSKQRGGISKEWRQKIENWLQANEQDEKHNDEYRKKLKHLTNNRRSLEKDAENTCKLDTLMEEKTQNSLLLNDTLTSNEIFKENDLSGKQIHESDGKIKVKVNKTFSPTKDDEKSFDKYMDILSKTSLELNNDKIEQDTNSEFAGNKNLHYSNDVINVNSINFTEKSAPNNKVEIDNENVETPPTSRKFKSSKIIEETVKPNQEILGDCYFDRFADLRRTRRFKRSMDMGSSDIIKESHNSEKTDPSNLHIISKNNNNDHSCHIDKKKDEVIHTKNRDVILRIGKIGKSMSRISQEDVREAIRSLKSPTPEKEKDWKKNDNFRFNKSSSIKLQKAEVNLMNDEGFEETQSLVSDTPSSYNDESKPKRNTIETKTLKSRLQNSNKNLIRPLPHQAIVSKNQQFLQRSRSLKTDSPMSIKNISQSNIQLRRSNSLNKNENNQINLLNTTMVARKKLSIHKSNSKSSLASSRTSLNSAISTNTVKKMPVKSNVSSSANLSIKRSAINMHNLKPSMITRISTPASRSSSSASSIGTSLRTAPDRIISSMKVSIPPSNLNVESKRRNVSNKISASNMAQKINVSANSNVFSNRISNSFMRPTTATRQKIKSK